MSNPRRPWPCRVGSVVVFAILILTIGCQDPNQRAKRPEDKPDPTPQQVAGMLEPNVLGVACYYDSFNPWIWNEDRTVVRGLKINALYLRGPNSIGVFGDGIIHPKLYVAYHDDQGKLAYKMVKEWTFDVQQAMPFRAKKRTKVGWGYALFLNWGDLNVQGRDVRLIVSFDRADGVMIAGSKKDFKIPK